MTNEIRAGVSGTFGKLPTVAIVGRPNVGKSSLFNCMVGRRIAIVHEQSGVTRDRVASPVSFQDCHFQLLDTGGLGIYEGETHGVDRWEAEIERQVVVAIEDSDLLVLVTDVTAGVTPLDRAVAERLRGSGRPVLLAVNKVDNPRCELSSAEFSSLGFADQFSISCVHRQGIRELLEAIRSQLPPGSAADNIPALRIAVSGRPNVGKSSLINRLLGQERVMVSEIAGTTRDAVDIPVDLDLGGEHVPAMLIDTAGLRKRGRADTAVEVFSIMRAENAVKRAQLVLLVLEAGMSGPTAQDRRIARIINDSGKACIVVANKWDLCRGEKLAACMDELRDGLPFLDYAPIVFVSAKSGYQFDRLLDLIGEVREQFGVHISTSVLNRLIEDAMIKTPPPLQGRSSFKVYYATMTHGEPPTFLLFVNKPKLCPRNYQLYLQHYLRRHLGLPGLPIRLEFKERSRRELHPGQVRSPKGKQHSRKPSGKRNKR